MVLDGAPNHHCSDLLLPGNISLLFLPPNQSPHSPTSKSYSDGDMVICRIDPVSLGERPQALLTILYCSTDCLCHGSAAV